MTVETIERPLVEGDQGLQLAEFIGLEPDNINALASTHVFHLGQIPILGTDLEADVKRFHCGPDESTKRGGNKFKAYPTEALQYEDGVDHSRSMLFKILGIDETGYGGGKTIINVNPRHLSPAQMIDAMGGVAALMYDAGLADPRIDGTAGDEGTNKYIDYYVEALRHKGHPHPEACITGKSDMHPRPAATGRGAAIVQRTRMRAFGQRQASSVIQGAGFAGAYYAAEAYDPLYPEDRSERIIISAIGDLDPHTDEPVVLYTDHPDGLPVTREMVDGILLHADTDPDMTHEKVKGFKLAALARKIEGQTGREVHITNGDVLLYDSGADYLVPAATSNVITPQNISQIRIREWLEIGNHTIRSDALPYVTSLGFTCIAGELVNSGGVKMSIEENRRDLAKISAHENGETYVPTSDVEYERRLHDTMTLATQRVLAIAEKFTLDTATAVQVVGLANYALSQGVHINPGVQNLLAA